MYLTKLCSKYATKKSFATLGSRWLGNSRQLSVLKASSVQAPPDYNDEHDDFMNLLPQIVKDLTEHAGNPEASERLSASFHYNVPSKRRLAGLLTITCYKTLETPKSLTPEKVKLANILGWCAEMLWCSFLVSDDVVDNATTRNGAPSWFRKEEIGLFALYDATIIHTGVFVLLKKYFSSHPFYRSMIDAFVDVIWNLSLGLVIEAGKHKPEQASMDKYRLVTEMKLSYPLLRLPTLMGMCLSETYSESMYRRLIPFLGDVGLFHQIQNDVDDCFDNPDEHGERGTDIQEGKRSWLYINALRMASPSQRQLMEDHYGKPDEASVRAVRNLYDELELRELFHTVKEESFKEFCDRCTQLENPQRDLMVKFARRIYKLEEKFSFLDN